MNFKTYGAQKQHKKNVYSFLHLKKIKNEVKPY